MREIDLVIIGGGPAGLSASISAYKEGHRNMVILERNDCLGGILNQCIHNGFGLHYFKEELTGPEYSRRLIDEVQSYKIPIELNCMVTNIDKNKIITILSEKGLEKIKAKAIILAMGCRERPRGAINIPGDRGSGIYSAGTAQELVNMKGYKVGNKAVILGSGDIGLIMARRLTFEGTKVEEVVELMPYSSGLTRNIVQCLEDFNIPISYNSTITRIVGKERVEGVYVAEVDENKVPILNTERFIECDTLLMSVGLIPENELSHNLDINISTITSGAIVDNSYETNVKGIFSCGNVLHVHDLVDNVTLESFEAGKNAVKYINKGEIEKDLVKLEPKNGIRYAVPQFIDNNNINDDIDIKFRVFKVFKNSYVQVKINGEEVLNKKHLVVTPGEMEKIKIKKEIIKKFNKIESIEISIKE